MFKSQKVIEYLNTKEDSLKKVINRMLVLLGSQVEYSPGPVIQVWFVLLSQVEQMANAVKRSAPQLISHSVQALSSGSVDSKGGVRAESTVMWKNRAEAAKLLTLIPSKLPPEVCLPYAGEVLHYLEQCRHDRVGRCKVIIMYMDIDRNCM